MKINLMLDSGAFSAWRLKKEIHLGDYIRFIQEHQEDIETVVNLDVIPGIPGTKPSKTVVEESASQGFKNMEVIRKEGLDVMPVFHQGERFYWLEKMIDAGCDYIGLSPRKDHTTKRKKQWLDSVFTYLCGKHGYPAVKTHAFGETSASILFDYPWFSADSTSWMLVGGYGGIIIPRRTVNGWDWSGTPRTVSVSTTENPDSGRVYRKELARNSYKFFSQDEQDLVRSWVEDECEQDFDYARSNYLGRCRCNVHYFLATATHLSTDPLTKRNLGIFRDFQETQKGSKKALNAHTRQVFSTVQSEGYLRVLDDFKVVDRLVSYWIFVQSPNTSLDHFTKPQPPIQDGKSTTPQVS